MALDEAWKAAGRGTGSREGTRGSEGSGRKCELYDLKKSLFYQEGLDEDDAELKRRIFEANEMFLQPLLDREIESTVLKLKGFKRHAHYNPAPLEMADPDVSAGSEISVHKERRGLKEVIRPAGCQKTL